MKIISWFKALSKVKKTVFISTISLILALTITGTSVSAWLLTAPTAAAGTENLPNTGSQNFSNDAYLISDNVESPETEENLPLEEENETTSSVASSSAASAASSSTSSATKKPSSTVSSSTAKKPSTSSTTSSTAKKPSSTASSSTASTTIAKLTLPTASQLQIVANEITRLTNEYRVKNNLLAFKTHSLLDKAAGIRAKELLKVYNGAHTRPDGSVFGTVLDEVGLRDTQECINMQHFGACGENIATKSSYDPVAWTNTTLKEWGNALFTAWTKSTGHRENMLRSYFTYMGVGCSAQIETGNSGDKYIAVYAEQLFTD